MYIVDNKEVSFETYALNNLAGRRSRIEGHAVEVKPELIKNVSETAAYHSQKFI